MKQRRTLAELQAIIESREGEFDRQSINKDKRTVELSFSSELPVSRWYGKEILSHDRGAMNGERLKTGRVNLLINHNPDDWVGVIEEARVDADKKGRAVVRFGNSPRADQIFRDVSEGILASVSFMYRRDEMLLSKAVDDGEDEYTVVRWTPLEISMVTVPADHTVAVGRSDTGDRRTTERNRNMNEAERAAAEAAAATAAATRAAPGAGDGSEALPAQPRQGPSAMDLENDRKASITNMCRSSQIGDDIKDMLITSGATVRQASDQVFEIVKSRGELKPQSAASLGLTGKETQSFSIRKAISAVADRNWNQAGFEAECSRTIAAKLGRQPDPQKFYVPYEVQNRGNQTPVEQLAYQMAKRDLTVATAGAGGFLVETANVGFIEILRNRSVLYNMGARRMSGLVGSVTIPKQTVAATPGWLANEAAQISESQQTFVQIALSPKNVGGYTEISRQLLLQSSPAAEGLVISDLAAVVALDIDLKGLNGSGASGQPTGIITTAGIGGVTGTSIAYAGILEFQTDVFAGNALSMSSGYVTTGIVAGLLKSRQRFSSTDTPLWAGRLDDGIVDSPNGYRGMASNQMPAGNLLFGDFGQVIVAEWGVLEVEVNPYANFQAGIIGVRAIASIDIAVRYATAFSLATSVT